MKGFIDGFKIPIAIVVGFVVFGLIVAGNSSRQPIEKTQQASISSSRSEQEVQQKELQGVVDSGEVEQQNFSLVTFVVDGDTIELESGERVRLIGVDAPERGDPYYQESKERLGGFVLNKQVRMEKDVSNTDRYGRLLRYLYVGNTFVNLEMVKQGYASAYTYPPDVKHSTQFTATETEARNRQVGLWAPVQQQAIFAAPQPSTSFSVPPCASSDCDCAHFSSHAHAQWFHDNHDPSDRHRLDRDKDGIACESLP